MGLSFCALFASALEKTPYPAGRQRNYNTMKNKKNSPDRLEMNKYCPFCRKHTVHTETK